MKCIELTAVKVELLLICIYMDITFIDKFISSNCEYGMCQSQNQIFMDINSIDVTM